jgi:hypothetical protein
MVVLGERFLHTAHEVKTAQKAFRRLLDFFKTLPFVEVIESCGGEPEWAVAKITDLWKRHNIRAVVVDGASAAASLIDPLRRAGATVTVTNAPRMAQAWGQFYDAVIGGQWSRASSESDITAVVAATLALWALTPSEVAEKPRVRSGRAAFA